MPQLYDWDRENTQTEPREDRTETAEFNKNSAPPYPDNSVKNEEIYDPQYAFSHPDRASQRNSEEDAGTEMLYPYRQMHFRRRSHIPAVIAAAAVITVAAVVITFALLSARSTDINTSDPSDLSGNVIEPPSSLSSSGNNNVKEIPVPDWVTQDLLPLNEYSRPGTALPQVNGVVVHYVGNPGTTAEQNRRYFANLAETHETWSSSHFVIGTDGKIIQCVPLNEISYCSNNRNKDTIAIECCHPDDTGKFTEETMRSLTRLLNWLIETYGLEREDILRHYDVTGKECPKYFVSDPEKWDAFLDTLTFSGNK